MKQYPPVHRIDDWENPWLPWPARLLNKFPNAWFEKYFQLDKHSLLESARRSTGLEDFGDNNFLEPFEILLQDLDEQNHLTPLGRITAHTILHQQLCSRLAIQDRLNQEPEAAEREIEQPVIIAGLPRTGTTHLHNLLSRVEQLRYLPWWQTLEPVQSYHQKNRHDRRRTSNNLKLSATNYLLPLFRRMHEMELDMPHEELTLSALCFRSFFFEGAFQVPRYRHWYASHEHSAGYHYMKSILQILQGEVPPDGRNTAKRWVLKSPQHVDQLETIANVFPNAKIILTHRDPVRAVLSMITMVLYTSRQVYHPLRLKQEARSWVERLEQMLRSCMEQRARLSSNQLLNIDFTNFMADQKGTIRNIMGFADLEMTHSSQTAIDELLATNVRDKHGRIDYHFEDLGLDEGEIRERFSFYTLD
jgi:hypothetical protein